MVSLTRLLIQLELGLELEVLVQTQDPGPSWQSWPITVTLLRLIFSAGAFNQLWTETAVIASAETAAE